MAKPFTLMDEVRGVVEQEVIQTAEEFAAESNPQLLQSDLLQNKARRALAIAAGILFSTAVVLVFEPEITTFVDSVIK